MNGPVQEGPDPREFLRLLWRGKWILVACLILIPLGVYVFSDRLPKTYEASTIVQPQASAADGPLTPDFTAPNDEASGVRLAALIETTGVADGAARLMREPQGSLRGSVRAEADQDTGFITITAHAPTAQRAAAIANAFADAVRRTRTQQGITRVDEAISGVQQQIKKTAPNSIDRRDATDQLQRLQTLRATQGQNLQVIEPASVPGSPAYPNPKRNAGLSLIVALLLGAGLVVLRDRMDRRLRNPGELETLTGVPLLVTLPPNAFPGSEPDPVVPIAFQTLRDSLTYFNVDQSLTSVLVTSPMKGDGKTTVAANLAVSFARAAKRVIVIDADLRNPQLATRLGVENTKGLGAVLMGASPEETLRDVEGFDGDLRVLPAGPPPPNPSELLGSVRMASLIERLEAECDLVIVDTPPLLVVSDAFALLERVSGTIGVARLEQTPRDAVRRMAEIIATARGRLLGVVATGGRPDASHGLYGYGYAYGGADAPQVAAEGQSRNGHSAARVASAEDSPPSNGSGVARRVAGRFRSR